jgi:2',3'-cyclic-nucleotide 2'-phosphodiesterase (5'-nucleotidase family)
MGATSRKSFAARCLSLALVAAALAVGCVEYNEECARLMEEPDGVSGYLGGDVTITKPEVRLKDNTIGQLVAESYLEAFGDQQQKFWPDLAVVNGGAIRSEGVCESRTSLKKGPVKRKVLRDILPFDNRVAVVSVTHHQLKNIFEHSIASYSGTDPKGQFLQVAGVEVFIDCREPGETLSADGKSRVTEGSRVMRILLHHRGCDVRPDDPACGTVTEIPLSPPSDTEKVRVAIDSYVQGGGDGFLDFKALDPNADDTLSAGSFNFEIVAQHFLKAYPASSPLPGEAAARVHMTECR